MDYIDFNGDINHKEKALLPVFNSAFKYGDGLFETMRMFDGEIPLLQDHYDRLTKGMKMLNIIIPEHYSCDYFKKQIERLFHANNMNRQGRVRLTVCRENTSINNSPINDPFFIIEIQALNNGKFKLNKKGLHIDVYEENTKSITSFSNYKTNNYLLSVLAGIYSKKQNMDDCLLMNDKKNIIESTISNLFIVSDNKLLTPPLTEGCVMGVMRKQIIEIAKGQKIKVEEKALSIENILDADEIFLTNAVKGIRWVYKFRYETYENNTALLLDKHLNNFIFTKNKERAGG